MLRTFSAFFLRDFRQTLSYRFAFVLDLASVVFSAATFYFLAKLFAAGSPEALAPYGGDYFPFVLIGLAFSTYQTIGLTSFSQSLRQEQYIGTLESVLVTPLRVSTFLAGSALWDFAYASLEIVFYFLIAFLAFGLLLPNAAVLPALAAVALTLVTFMGLGILAAAFILRYKKGNPVAFIIATASELLGGVYFPVEILPGWMKAVSQWVPMTHALKALRGTLLAGESFREIAPHLFYLSAFTLIVWPLGVAAFSWALQKSREDGTLGHY